MIWLSLSWCRDVLKPLVEFGNAETAHSVAFSLHTPRTLMAGMNNKQIKLFDLRGIVTPHPHEHVMPGW